MQVQTTLVRPYMIQYCLPNYITFLVTVDKFDPNPILVNINKPNPIDSKTQLLLKDWNQWSKGGWIQPIPK
jgi:hypothetical protein